MSNLSPDLTNWYWIVGGDNTRAYSSKAGDFVPSADATYVAWLAAGNLPTNAASEAELGATLAPYLLRPVAAAVLDGYQDAHAGAIVVTQIFKILFNHENRLRAVERQLVLNGSPANLTAAQARAAVKTMM